MSKEKTRLAKLVDTATKYEDAVRIHSIMQRAIDDERNIQAGKVYELAQSFRAQIREVEPYVEGLVREGDAARALLARISQRLRADVGSEAEFFDLLGEIDAMTGQTDVADEVVAQAPLAQEEPREALPQANFGF